jgi:hypothetical protein
VPAATAQAHASAVCMLVEQAGRGVQPVRGAQLQDAWHDTVVLPSSASSTSQSRGAATDINTTTTMLLRSVADLASASERTQQAMVAQRHACERAERLDQDNTLLRNTVARLQQQQLVAQVVSPALVRPVRPTQQAHATQAVSETATQHTQTALALLEPLIAVKAEELSSAAQEQSSCADQELGRLHAAAHRDAAAALVCGEALKEALQRCKVAEAALRAEVAARASAQAEAASVKRSLLAAQEMLEAATCSQIEGEASLRRTAADLDAARRATAAAEQTKAAQATATARELEDVQAQLRSVQHAGGMHASAAARTLCEAREQLRVAQHAQHLVQAALDRTAHEAREAQHDLRTCQVHSSPCAADNMPAAVAAAAAAAAFQMQAGLCLVHRTGASISCILSLHLE